MSNRPEQVAEHTNTSSARPQSRRRRILRFFLLFLGALILGGAWLYYHETTAPINVENASRARALGWLALRDFAEESDETREKLFDYYYANLGGGAGNAESTDAPKKPKLKMPKSLRSVSGLFLSNADAKAKEWASRYDRPSYVRIDYVVRRSGQSASPYVCSRDVTPGPSLTRRWNAARAAVAQGKVKKSKIERNIQTLVMQWFVSKYRRYDATSDERKSEYLERTADEMESLQEFYELARSSSGVEEPLTRVALIAEFERMLEGWCEVAPLAKVAKAVWFKDVLITTIVARELRLDNETLALYPPRYCHARNEREQAVVEKIKTRATEAARAIKARVVRTKE